jgi:hypothetical protein
MDKLKYKEPPHFISKRFYEVCDELGGGNKQIRLICVNLWLNSYTA